jgi:Tol biopolymer transport system component
VTSGVAGAAQHPSLSQDGTRLLFDVAIKSGNIARIRFDPEAGLTEGAPELVTRGANGFSAPDVAPGSGLLTFCSCWIRAEIDENIYVARPDGGDLRALTDDVGHSNRLPRWTADGKRIVFYSNRGGSWAVWSVAPDGSGLRAETDAPGRVMLFSIPAREGTRVVTWVNMEGMALLDLAQPVGTRILGELPAYPEESRQFVPNDWSPDGHAVVGWVGAHGRSTGIFRFDLESRQYTRVTKSGQEPRYVAAGRRLLYTDEGGLWLADASGSGPRRLLSLEPDSFGDQIALAPDERWIYFSWRVEDGDVWLAEK